MGATLTVNGKRRGRPPASAKKEIKNPEEGSPMPEQSTPTNDAEDTIVGRTPYEALIRVKGDAPIFFHRYSCEAVEAKGNAKKGSQEKKTDDLESYVYRDSKGNLGVPTLNFIAAIAHAGRSHRDPRSPRKSAHDLLKALIVPGGPEIAPLLPKTKLWDYIDKRRACVQRVAIPRSRPVMHEGWEVEFQLRILSADYLSPKWLRQLVIDAGMFAGLCDQRPTYGRFSTVKFEVVELK